MNHLISIQAAADEYSISTRWIWKSIRVDRTLGAVVRNGRIYLRRIEWEAFVERHPRLIEEWHDYMHTDNTAISGNEKERKVERIVSPIGDLCIYGQAHDQTGKVLQ